MRSVASNKRNQHTADKQICARTPIKNQKGVALMMVLFVFALVTILAGGMISRQSLFIKKTSNILIQAQAYEYALSAEQFSRQILFTDWEKDRDETLFKDDLEEDWAIRATAYPFDMAVIEGQIDDLQGKLNINGLVNSDGSIDQVVVERFANLLVILGVNLDTDKLIDWIDENDEIQGDNGAEEGNYLIKERPYRTGNQPFLSVSELMLIDGVTPVIYQTVLPHISALPTGVKSINVNTCTEEVIRSLPKERTLSELEGKAIISERPYKNIEDFRVRPEFAGLTLEGAFSINTEFFQVSSRVTLADRVSRLVSVLYRDSNNGGLTLLSRDQGQKYIIAQAPTI